jgi:hypothetical protein
MGGRRLCLCAFVENFHVALRAFELPDKVSE